MRESSVLIILVTFLFTAMPSFATDCQPRDLDDLSKALCTMDLTLHMYIDDFVGISETEDIFSPFRFYEIIGNQIEHYLPVGPGLSIPLGKDKNNIIEDSGLRFYLSCSGMLDREVMLSGGKEQLETDSHLAVYNGNSIHAEKFTFTFSQIDLCDTIYDLFRRNWSVDVRIDFALKHIEVFEFKAP